ncbi:hypothetical protein CYMTET_33781 [Cymbomonas tetramitiformis]|uniref:Uncharacterized protein n=1 Tax=Cymbomonas tetramitiformis TaxID=36881 RepID=A0AAE0KQU9_9CHLO|nr:hypothetical protein CYMTET_33781 [Cymbomonas tetramitiformis]
MVSDILGVYGEDMRVAGKNDPLYYGMDPETLWDRYAACKLQSRNEIDDMCEYVHKLRPRSLQDFKPLLILTQSLLQDFVDGKRRMFCEEMDRMKEQHEFDVNELNEQLSQLQRDIAKLSGEKRGMRNKELFMNAARNVGKEQKDRLDAPPFGVVRPWKHLPPA